jgi:hypothetical protein
MTHQPPEDGDACWQCVAEDRERELAEARALLERIADNCVPAECLRCEDNVGDARAYLAGGAPGAECRCERWEALGHFKDCPRRAPEPPAPRCTCPLPRRAAYRVDHALDCPARGKP